jgi:hypothetical protein
MSEKYAIMDLDSYITDMRNAAAESIAPDNKDNLDEYITLSQMRYLVESWCIGHDDSLRPILDEEANQNIFEDVMIWISNSGLAKLAAEGLIECAWDSDANEFIFWSSAEKPEKKDGRPKSKRKNKGSKRKDT